MFRRFKKSAVLFACPIPLAAALMVQSAAAQQLPEPVPAAPDVIGETPAQPGSSSPLPEPYSLQQQAPQPSAESQKRPSLGVVAEERRDRTGLTVLSVRELSPAAQAGVLEGDILTGLNGVQTNSIEDVSSALTKLRAGDPVAIEVSREGLLFELRAAMSDAPPPSADDVPREIPGAGDPSMGPSRGILGVTVEDASAPLGGAPVLRGARVISVTAQSPAESIGIRPGDTIVSIDGQVMYGARELTTYMQNAQAGESVEIGYYQDRVLRRKKITLADSGQPLPGAVADDRGDMVPGIVIRPGANVGEILQDVGRTLDGILGPRPARQMPRQAPAESFAAPAPPAIPTPAPSSSRRIPTPDAAPAPGAEEQSEVVRLRRQVEQLLERVQQLESQLDKDQQPQESGDGQDSL